MSLVSQVLLEVTSNLYKENLRYEHSLCLWLFMVHQAGDLGQHFAQFCFPVNYLVKDPKQEKK